MSPTAHTTCALMAVSQAQAYGSRLMAETRCHESWDLSRKPLLRQLYRADDSAEHGAVGVELLARRHAERIQQRSVTQLRRVDVDDLLAARRVGHVRQH